MGVAQGAVTVDISTADTGLHELVWTIERTVSELSDVQAEALRNLVLTQP